MVLLNAYFALKSLKFELTHPYVIFLGTFTLFLLSRVILDVLQPSYDFARTNILTYYTYDYATQQRLLENLIIALFSLHLGATLAYGFSHKARRKGLKELSPQKTWRDVGLFFFYIGLPFLAFQYIQIAKEVIKHGYYILYTGGLQYSNSLITVFFSRLSWMGFFVFLVSMPPKKMLLRNLLVFALVLIPRLLQGSRGAIMCLLLTLLWYVPYIYNYRLKIKTILLISIALVFINIFVGSFRSGSDYHKRDHFVKLFFFDQGISIQVLAYAIDHEALFDDYGFDKMFAKLNYVLSASKNKLQRNGEVISRNEQAEEYCFLSYRLAKRLNKPKFNSGIDIGGSYVAEYYLLGHELGQFIGGLLFGFFFVYGVEQFKRHRVGLLVLLLALPSLLYIPRDSTFDFIADNVSNIILVLIIMGTLMLVSYNKAWWSDMKKRLYKDG